MTPRTDCHLLFMLGVTNNFIYRARACNYYVRTVGVGSGIVDTGIDLSNITAIWGIGMIVIVCGIGEGGLYLVWGSNAGINTETLKAHPSITSFTLDNTTKHLKINHSGSFVAKIVHNMEFSI